MPPSDATGDAARDRFRVLPEPMRPEDWVETVDAAEHPALTEEDEWARLLRLAGGAAPRRPSRRRTGRTQPRPT